MFNNFYNVEEYGRAKEATDNSKIRRNCIVCDKLRLQTHTLIICNTGFPQQQW